MLESVRLGQDHAGWLAWCLLQGKGMTAEGRPLQGLAEVAQYALEMASTGKTPPLGADAAAIQQVVAGFGVTTVLAHLDQSIHEIIAFLNSLTSQGLYHLAHPLVAPLARYLPLLPAGERFTLGYLLATIAREQHSNREALELLRQIEPIAGQAPPDTQAAFHHALGNSLKDLGYVEEARGSYERAADLARTSAPQLLGVIYMQLGRLTRERGNVDEAAEHYRKAETHGFSAVGDEAAFALLNRINQTEALLAQGKPLDAWQSMATLFAALPEERPLYYEEGTLQSLVTYLAAHMALGLPEEWATRMAIVARQLSGRQRELSSVYGNLTRCLIGAGRGAEFKFWHDRTERALGQTGEELNRPPALCTLAFGLFVFGLTRPGLERFQESLAAARDQRQMDVQIHALAQMALASWGVDPALSEQAAAQVKKLLEQGAIPPQARHQLKFLAARELLAQPPDVLQEWEDALRAGKSRLGGRLEALQQVLDVFGEADGPSAGPLPRPILVRGFLHGYLCGRGFLDFLKTFVGLVPRQTVDWALSRAPASTWARRLALEWAINPNGTRQEQQRGQPAQIPMAEGQSRWQDDLPSLRSAMMRFFFQQDLAGLTAAEQQSYPFAHQPAEMEKARHDMAGLYRRWRRALVIERDDLLIDLDHHARVRNKTHTFSVSAAEMGIRLDNFLETELIDPVSNAWPEQVAPPVLIDVFQGEDRLHWIIVDLAQAPTVDRVRIESVPITRTSADDLVSCVVRVLEHQERGQGHKVSPPSSDGPRHLRATVRDSMPRDVSRLFLDCPPLFAPLIHQVQADREIWLSVTAPWSSIPFEHLPLGSDGSTMSDRYWVMRRDRFRRWLTPPQRAAAATAAVFGDPLQEDPRFALPHAREEARAVGSLLGVQACLGPECTREQVKRSLPGNALIHLACHGHVFDRFGDFQVLCLADGYLLGQELAALDLSACRLAVLSACYSGSGSAFGTAPMESLAEYLIEAGARAALASTSLVSDGRTSQLMGRFYGALRGGDTILGAMRRSLGKDARLAHGIVVSPWVLVGRDGPVLNG